MNARFIHRPVTPGVAGSSPVHSANKSNGLRLFAVTRLTFIFQALEYVAIRVARMSARVLARWLGHANTTSVVDVTHHAFGTVKRCVDCVSVAALHFRRHPVGRHSCRLKRAKGMRPQRFGLARGSLGGTGRSVVLRRTRTSRTEFTLAMIRALTNPALAPRGSVTLRGAFDSALPEVEAMLRQLRERTRDPVRRAAIKQTPVISAPGVLESSVLGMR